MRRSKELLEIEQENSLNFLRTDKLHSDEAESHVEEDIIQFKIQILGNWIVHGTKQTKNAMGKFIPS